VCFHPDYLSLHSAGVVSTNRLQSQCRTAEEQLIRSLERERELRVQLADNDVSAIIGNLREENHALRVDNDYLREQVAILMQDVQMHAELKPELEILKQEVREAGFEHHHALSSLSREKEQLASEASEALSALRNELEIRAQGYEEDTVRVEARTRLLEDHVAELEENLVEARGLVISAEESAKAYSTHNTLLENDMASGGRRIAEQEADINELRERLAGMQQDLQFAEKAHMAGSSQNEQLVAENAEKSELVKSLEDSVKAAEDNGKHELEMLSMHIEDQKRKIATLVGEVQRAENEAKASRDQMRSEALTLPTFSFFSLFLFPLALLKPRAAACPTLQGPTSVRPLRVRHLACGSSGLNPLAAARSSSFLAKVGSNADAITLSISLSVDYLLTAMSMIHLHKINQFIL